MRRTIAIYFDNENKCLILNDVQTYVDTGIIDGRVIRINEDSHLGSAFHMDITHSGENPGDYRWFQIVTDKNKFFEAALKNFEFRKVLDSDFL